MFISRKGTFKLCGQADMHKNLVSSQGFNCVSVLACDWVDFRLVQRPQWEQKDFQFTTIEGLALVLLSVFPG